MSDIWLQPSFGENLFGAHEAVWCAPNIFPENHRPSPLIPHSQWYMAPRVYAWLAPRLKELSITAIAEPYSADHEINVVVDGIYIGFLHLQPQGSRDGRAQELAVVERRRIADSTKLLQHVPTPEERIEHAKAMLNDVIMRNHIAMAADKILYAEPAVKVCWDSRWDEMEAPAWRRIWKRIKGYFRRTARA